MWLASKCKWLRKALRLSQKDLAVTIGTTQTNISFIERGFIPSENITQAIIDLYNKAVTYENK